MNINSTDNHCLKKTQKNAFVKIIRLWLKQKHFSKKINAFKFSTKFTEELIDLALDDKYLCIRENTIRLPNVNHKQINKALNDKNWLIRMLAVKHSNSKNSHIDKALKDKNWLVRHAAICSTNATPEHFRKALNDKCQDVRRTATKRLVENTSLSKAMEEVE